MAGTSLEKAAHDAKERIRHHEDYSSFPMI
jgi:hypothetical protein